MEKSYKEQRIRKVTELYYSRPEIQKVIFEFCKNREISPRYFEGFGKRPDVLEYPNDILTLVKKGATSFHCSEELWSDPLKIETGMIEKQLNEIRIGWDLIIDIDSKYIDYSKIMAKLIIELLKFHRVKNIGIKFSGSKGFHLIVPWNSFPKEVNEIKTSEKFPEYPRIITKYIMEKIKDKLIEKISELQRPNKYIKDYEAPKEVMPDLVLVSPRHLFRTPYSLHEKTALASIVLSEQELQDFELKDADISNIPKKIKKFFPDSEENEASELLREALDWNRYQNPEDSEEKTFTEFKPIKLENLSEEHFPDSIKKILQGLNDGRKRGLFILLNFFRSLGMDKDELEKRIEDWNNKNSIPLKKGYIQSQILWSYRRKSIMPPNFNSDIYKGIGIIPTEHETKSKNPVSYTIKRNFSSNNHKKKKPKN